MRLRIRARPTACVCRPTRASALAVLPTVASTVSSRSIDLALRRCMSRRNDGRVQSDDRTCKRSPERSPAGALTRVCSSPHPVSRHKRPSSHVRSSERCRWTAPGSPNLLIEHEVGVTLRPVKVPGGWRLLRGIRAEAPGCSGAENLTGDRCHREGVKPEARTHQHRDGRAVREAPRGRHVQGVGRRGAVAAHGSCEEGEAKCEGRLRGPGIAELRRSADTGARGAPLAASYRNPFRGFTSRCKWRYPAGA